MHESLIWALKINEITDCDTFVGLDESEPGMKSSAADFGVDIANGELSHERELARVITACKQGKFQTDEVAQAHGHQSQCYNATAHDRRRESTGPVMLTALRRTTARRTACTSASVVVVTSHTTTACVSTAELLIYFTSI